MFELFRFEAALNWQNRKHLIWEGILLSCFKNPPYILKVSTFPGGSIGLTNSRHPLSHLKKKIKLLPYKNFLQAKEWHARACPGAIRKELCISKFSACRSCCIDNSRYQRVLFNLTSCSRANVSSATALYLTVGWTQSQGGVRGSLALQAHSSRKLTFNSQAVSLIWRKLSSKYLKCLNDFLRFKHWSTGLCRKGQDDCQP